MSAAPIGLSPAAARRIRRVTVATVLLLALAAAVLSFSGLVTLAEESGIPTSLAWLLPVIIDGMVVTGSLGVIAATLSGVPTWYSWMLTLLGVTASVVGNVAAAPDDLMSQAVHATPPITFALAVEGLLRVYRIQAFTAMNQPVPPPRASRSARTAPKRTDATRELAAGGQAGPQVGAPADPSPEGTARERLGALLGEEPDITGAEASRRLGTDPSHTRRLLRELRAPSQAAESPSAPEAPSASVSAQGGASSLEE